MDKINILCLHGFTRNAQQVISCVKKALNINKMVNLYGFDGIVDLPNTNDECSKAYWVYDTEDLLNVPSWGGESLTKTKFYFDQSLEMLCTYVKTIGKIHGIIGFSQGGMFLDKLCQLQKENKLSFTFDFAVFVATCNFDHNLDTIDIPSLHIYGIDDKIVPFDKSDLLAKKYVDCKIYIHNGKHIFPTNKELKNDLSTFIKNNKKSC